MKGYTYLYQIGTELALIAGCDRFAARDSQPRENCTAVDEISFNECVTLDQLEDNGAFSASDMCHKTDIVELLQQALEKLDPELRAVLETKYRLDSSEEVTNQEVAQQLGTTVDSVVALEEVALRALYAPGKRAN